MLAITYFSNSFTSTSYMKHPVCSNRSIKMGKEP